MFKELKKRMQIRQWNNFAKELVKYNEFCDINKNNYMLVKYVKLDKNNYNLIVISHNIVDTDYRLIINYPFNTDNKGIILLKTNNQDQFIEFTKIFLKGIK